MRHAPKFAILFLIFNASSCAWYKNLERSLVEDENKGLKSSQTVSRSQYDKLLLKYEELAKKYEELKENPNAGKPSLISELKNTQSENFAVSQETETIDVFAENKEINTNKEIEISSDVESQIGLYKKGLDLLKDQPGEATKIFQQLDSKAILPLRVRAKYQLGELLKNQGQYDLSMQIFEDIINNHAHSGIVLDALKSAVVCAEKLGTIGKKDQYASMLNDVFDSK